MQVACRANSDDGFAINNRRHGRGRELRQPLSVLAVECVDLFGRCGEPQFRAGPLFRRAFQLRHEFRSVVLGNVSQSVFAEVLDQVQQTCDQSLGIRTELQVLRPQAGFTVSSPPQCMPLSDRISPARKKIHFRASGELSNEHVSGRFVKLHRTSEQHDHAVAKYDDLGGQDHRLHLVVRHVDHRGPEPLMKAGDFDPRLPVQ